MRFALTARVARETFRQAYVRSNHTMKKSSAIPKPRLAYPEDTKGSRLAAEVRKKASGLTDGQREKLFARAMARIYGAANKQAVRA